MEWNERIQLFGELLLCCHNLYLSVYDEELRLLQSNCPAQEACSLLVQLGEQRQRIARYAANNTQPIFLSNALDILWIGQPEWREGKLRRIYLMGPFFMDDRAAHRVERALRERRYAPQLIEQVQSFLQELPVLAITRVYEYAMMLYYCIYGQRISVSEIHFPQSEPAGRRARGEARKDVHGTYEMEREMVRMVREGDLGFMKQVDRLAVTGSLGKLSNGEPNRQIKNAVLVCVVLFSRAAIEGGLAPEIALALTDHYFQSVEACNKISELGEITATMQNDFVQRVHSIKTQQHSPLITECRDYIDLHIDEELSLKELAEKHKYSEGYLGRKFRQEMGVGFNEYVRSRRLERAKELLRSTNLSVREISDRLHFCTHSYFSEAFKAAYGLSPTQWRDRSN